MNIHLHSPASLYQTGGRVHNEDALFPAPDTGAASDRLFIVCDGVGGSQKGEVASQLACTSLASYLAEHRPPLPPDEAYFQAAIDAARGDFDKYLAENPEARGMGTTVTLLYLHEEGITAAHLGDSRIYHFRGGRVQWRSSDHSWVNEMVAHGILSPEDAAYHPNRNVITRALQGSDEKPSYLDVHQIHDVQAGDRFLLCTDGVIEHYDDAGLAALFGQAELGPAALAQAIIQQGNQNPRDNFSAYILEISEVEGEATVIADMGHSFAEAEAGSELPEAQIEPETEVADEPDPPVTSPPPSRRRWGWWLPLILLLAVAGLYASGQADAYLPPAWQWANLTRGDSVGVPAPAPAPAPEPAPTPPPPQVRSIPPADTLPSPDSTQPEAPLPPEAEPVITIDSVTHLI